MARDLLKILLLEDDPTQSMTVCAALDGIVGRVTTVQEVGDAIALAKRSPFDLCLIDLGVYDANGDYRETAGIDFISAARDDTCRAAPMIVMTACRDPNVLLPCFEAGADDYVLKTEGIKRTVASVKRWGGKLPLTPMDLFMARRMVVGLLEDTVTAARRAAG